METSTHLAPSVPDVPDLDASVARLRALADEKRFRIVLALALGERCVCELQDALGGVGQSLLSFHLKTLKEAGLVRDRREGRWVYYALRRETLGTLEATLGAIRANGADGAAAPRDPRCG